MALHFGHVKNQLVAVAYAHLIHCSPAKKTVQQLQSNGNWSGVTYIIQLVGFNFFLAFHHFTILNKQTNFKIRANYRYYRISFNFQIILLNHNSTEFKYVMLCDSRQRWRTPSVAHHHLLTIIYQPSLAHRHLSIINECSTPHGF